MDLGNDMALRKCTHADPDPPRHRYRNFIILTVDKLADELKVGEVSIESKALTSVSSSSKGNLDNAFIRACLANNILSTSFRLAITRSYTTIQLHVE